MKNLNGVTRRTFSNDRCRETKGHSKRGKSVGEEKMLRSAGIIRRPCGGNEINAKKFRGTAKKEPLEIGMNARFLNKRGIAKQEKEKQRAETGADKDYGGLAVAIIHKKSRGRTGGKRRRRCRGRIAPTE